MWLLWKQIITEPKLAPALRHPIHSQFDDFGMFGGGSEKGRDEHQVLSIEHARYLLMVLVVIGDL